MNKSLFSLFGSEEDERLVALFFVSVVVLVLIPSFWFLFLVLSRRLPSPRFPYCTRGKNSTETNALVSIRNLSGVMDLVALFFCFFELSLFDRVFVFREKSR